MSLPISDAQCLLDWQIVIVFFTGLVWLGGAAAWFVCAA
jgi:hypothetical protein